MTEGRILKKKIFFTPTLILPPQRGRSEKDSLRNDIYIHPHPALSPQGRGKKEMTGG